MDKKEVIIFAAAMVFLAFRLYQKYVKKNNGKTGVESKPPTTTSFPSSVKDDDYEPYSKK
jgi:hypothetical protein